MTELLTPAGLGALGTFLAILFGGVWKLVERADKKAQKREDELLSRIERLEAKIEGLERREDIYLRRIYQLEGVIAASGHMVPMMQGWPP